MPLHKIKRKKHKKSSLQVQICKIREAAKKQMSRAFCPASCEGTFTVEAAFVLPLVIFVFCAFLYFLVILNMQIILYEPLVSNARAMARYAFAYEEILHMTPSQEREWKDNMDSGLTDVLFHGFSCAYTLEQIKQEAGAQWLEDSCIQGGASGLSLLGDSLLDNNEMVDMVLRYKVDIPYLPGGIFDFLCVQRVRIRAFTGFMPAGEGENQEKEQMVYVTETGKVYHTNKYCTHLNLSVKGVGLENIETLRNSNGGKYYACELCGGTPQDSGMVYLTRHGDRYHGNTDCSGLKRTWTELPLSEVGDRSLCTRCQKQQ